MQQKPKERYQINGKVSFYIDNISMVFTIANTMLTCSAH